MREALAASEGWVVIRLILLSSWWWQICARCCLSGILTVASSSWKGEVWSWVHVAENCLFSKYTQHRLQNQVLARLHGFVVIGFWRVNFEYPKRISCPNVMPFSLPLANVGKTHCRVVISAWGCYSTASAERVKPDLEGKRVSGRGLWPLTQTGRADLIRPFTSGPSFQTLSVHQSQLWRVWDLGMTGPVYLSGWAFVLFFILTCSAPLFLIGL